MFDAKRGLTPLCLTLALLATASGALSDPMRPDTARPEPRQAPAPQPEPSFTLTSIYRVDQQAYAVINGQWLTLNDTLNNYELMAIGSDEVLLQRGNRTRTLTLRQAGSLAITPTDEE